MCACFCACRVRVHIRVCVLVCVIVRARLRDCECVRSHVHGHVRVCVCCSLVAYLAYGLPMVVQKAPKLSCIRPVVVMHVCVMYYVFDVYLYCSLLLVSCFRLSLVYCPYAAFSVVVYVSTPVSLNF